MSERLDLVSLCHRAPVDVNHKGYICEKCGANPCEAVRPDRGVPYDPERKEWKRKAQA